ncbi:MAG TPA: substrate-binding domain-containing protein [Solirubrobacteraceae bacterium]|jgi:simple sugar transport system substrate-binding protein|nr:substrate-binding domain-containing protein [Solirubrobacteraceae bacterium]
MRRLAVPIVVAAAALLPAACGGSSKSSGSGSSSTQAVNIASGSKPCTYRFAVITHGDNGSFWSVVYKGAKNAAADMGCTLTEVYGSQQQGQAEPDDSAENAQIQDAVNAHVDGIAVSDHDPSLMNPTLKSAAAKGIPVVLLNAGCDNADIAASGALTCVGQPEQLAGQAAGARFKSLGTTNVLCVIHQSGQNLLDRCNGIAQGLGVGSQCKSGNPPAKGPACTEVTLSTPNAASNPQQAIGQVTSYLQAHPQINAVMTLNNAIATALVTSHPANNVKVSTFDLNAGVQSDIQNGTMAFAVDQQQYLQGYLPIQFLYLYKKHEGQSVGGGTTVASGPLLVDKTNIAKVSSAINAGDD